MAFDRRNERYHGDIALALVVSLLRELHHEGLMTEERFKRVLHASAGVMRVLLDVRRDFEPVVDERTEEIDYAALTKDMMLGKRWATEETIEQIMCDIEETFFKLDK